MAEENNENKGARSAQEAEMKKLGITPHSERKGKSETDSDLEEDEVEELEDEETEEDDSETESEDEEEDSEEEEESEDESENEEDEDEEDEEEESQSHKKKGVPYKVHNQLRSDLRKAIQTIKDLTDNKKEEIPDDFEKRTEDLAKEIGVENPEGLKKIMGLVKEFVSNNSKKSKEEFESKLAEMEEKYGKIIKDTPVQDEFGKEWKTFEKSSFIKEFPNATDEEIEAAQNLMNELSHTPGIGGKAYTDKDGRKLLDPYELDYVYFKNKDKFAELITGKKTRGLETNRTQGIKKGQEGKEENKPLRRGASAKEIQAYEKSSARAIEGLDNLSEPVDDTI